MLNEVVLLLGVLVGNLTITSYQSIRSQTDDSPFFTSIGDRTHVGGCAISRDLLCKVCRKLHARCKHPENKGVHYGDKLYVEGHGVLKVNDVMGETKYDRKTKKRYPIVMSLDIWVPSLAEESKVKVQFRNVYKVTKDKQNGKKI